MASEVPEKLTLLGATAEAITGPEEYAGPGVHITVRHPMSPPEWRFEFEDIGVHVTVEADGCYDVYFDGMSGSLFHETDDYDDAELTGSQHVADYVEAKLVRFAEAILAKARKPEARDLAAALNGAADETERTGV
jgi:hypothetical protein